MDREATSLPLSPEAVRSARFSTRRRGYDEDEVRLLLGKLANDIQAADAERASMRADLHGARAEIDRLRQENPGQPGQAQMELSVHAVGLLSQAQQTADSCVAEAEQYARELIEAARSQYHDILQRAQEAAANSVRDISSVNTAGSAGVHGDYSASVPEIEYVRTYARVAQVQLRSVLDALTQEVDKLGQISQLDDSRSLPAASGASEDVSWEPNNLVSLPSRGYETDASLDPSMSDTSLDLGRYGGI